MTSQVVFRIDTDLKKKAMKKAKNDGLPFSSVLKFATDAYVKGQLSVGVIKEEKFNAKTRRLITRELKEIEEGKNMAGPFKNAKDAIKYLRDL